MQILEDRIDDKVFVRGKWISLSSEAINKLLGAPNHEKDDYFVLMDERAETNELEEKLY